MKHLFIWTTLALRETYKFQHAETFMYEHEIMSSITYIGMNAIIS